MCLFLFVDKNSNGIADDGTEFFGTSTEYSGGFAHLATMDTNKDGTVSVKDKGFGNLERWHASFWCVPWVQLHLARSLLFISI